MKKKVFLITASVLCVVFFFTPVVVHAFAAAPLDNFLQSGRKSLFYSLFLMTALTSFFGGVCYLFYLYENMDDDD